MVGALTVIFYVMLTSVILSNLLNCLLFYSAFLIKTMQFFFVFATSILTLEIYNKFGYVTIGQNQFGKKINNFDYIQYCAKVLSQDFF